MISWSVEGFSGRERMVKEPYQRIGHGQLGLTDQLAIERTSLANERTLLSYVRTMIGIIAIGGTLIKFFTELVIVVVGWGFVLMGLVILLIGFLRYIRMSQYIYSLNWEETEKLLERDPMQHLVWSMMAKLHLAKLKG